MIEPDRGALGVELEHALVHAETLLAAVDQATWRLNVLRAWQLVFLLAGAAVTGGLVDAGGLAAAVAAVSVAAASGGGVGVLFLATTRMRGTRDRDAMVMVSLSRTARDLLPVVAQDEQWSELRLATTRARIARFPISERSR
ncbi:hypothetical protein ABTZ99_39930 [Actinosynnema sp. NPDC002837]|jgi:hypothetical protein